MVIKCILFILGCPSVHQVSKSKQWKQIAIEIAVGNSNSAAFTLKKNYIRHLLAYECLFDRGGIDPQQILAEIDTTSTKKSKDSTCELLLLSYFVSSKSVDKWCKFLKFDVEMLMNDESADK